MPTVTRAKSAPLRRILLLPLFSFTIVSFAGCSLGGFISAYFNTYYNARRLFNESEEDIRTQKATGVKQGPEVYLAPFNIQATTRTKLNSVIEKCSKLLQYHPESGLVEDALLMIGKAYFYLDENQKAERKFNELIEGYPQSGLLFEAKLLRAQVYYRMNDANRAMNAAKDLLEASEKSGNDDIMAQAATVCANVQLNNKDYPQSISYFQIVAEHAGSGEDRAAAEVKMAEVYQLQGQFSNAVDAYRRAENKSGAYVVRYRGRFGEARMIAKIGKPEEALSILKNLRSNANNKEFYGEIDLEIGNTLNQMNALDDAVEQYKYVDTTYARTETAAKSYYALALLYETKFGLYDSARVLYNKVKFEFLNTDVGLLAAHRADYLNRFATLREQMAKLDSMHMAILHPSPPPADSAGSDSTLAQSSRTDTAKAKFKVPTAPLSLDSIQAGRERATIELAGLFFFDIGATDSAGYWYHRLLTAYPKSTFAPRALFMLAQIAGQDTTNGKSRADSLYRVLIARYPESEFAGEAARFLGLRRADTSADDAARLYARGAQLLSAGSDSAAIDTFRIVVRNYPTSPFASKAQYAAGWVYEELQMNQDSAVAQYRRLVSAYPTSEYAARVRPKIAEVEVREKELQDLARKDSAKTEMMRRPSPGKGLPADSLEKKAGRLGSPLQKELQNVAKTDTAKSDLTPRSAPGKGPSADSLGKRTDSTNIPTQKALQDSAKAPSTLTPPPPEMPQRSEGPDTSVSPGVPTQPPKENPPRE